MPFHRPPLYPGHRYRRAIIREAVARPFPTDFPRQSSRLVMRLGRVQQPCSDSAGMVVRARMMRGIKGKRAGTIHITGKIAQIGLEKIKGIAQRIERAQPPGRSCEFYAFLRRCAVMAHCPAERVVGTGKARRQRALLHKLRQEFIS